MAPLSEGEENYVRLCILLKGVSPRAVRNFFDSKFPPTYLPSMLNSNYTTLHDLKLNRVLNQAQWNLLFPNKGLTDSTTFDVTLMICLIRNLTNITPPNNGFDRLPLPGETTPGSDLARIKWYRNILAHESSTIATVEFNAAWTNISDAVSRLGGGHMYQECQDLKVKILDQSNQEIMLEFKQSQEDMKEIKHTMDSLETENSRVKENLRDLQDSHFTLKTKVTEILKDTIPWNIRGQIKEELETWIEDDKMFIETNGAKSVLKFIKESGCVVVTGSSGTGKSSLVRHVALQMQEEGYDILPLANPEEIIKWYNPSKKILYVVDDFCGTYTIDPMKFENWKNLMEKIKTLVEKKPVKLIMSCRLQVYKDEKMKLLSFFRSCECNLLSQDLCLSTAEKQSIAELYLKSNASKISEFYDMFDCFPLLCQLCSKNAELSIVDFFKNPFTIYKEEIDKLQTEVSHVKYCALALCVIFNNHLKEEWLIEDVNKNIKTIINNTFEACKVVKGTSHLVLRDVLDSLTQTFIRKDGQVYRTIHDKLFDFLAFYFGSVMIHCIIDNASSRFLSERFLFENKKSSDEFIIIVPDSYQQMYIKRIVNDLSRGNVQDVYCNSNMENQIFKQRFLVHIKHLEKSQQKQLAGVFDIHDSSTPLIQCCYDGDINMVKWCLYRCKNNFNHSRKDDGVSALYMACQEGHTKVVSLLINNKADINKCINTGESPLYIACYQGYTEVVQMLINNKADVNKCTNHETSPLYVACLNGHTEVVRILITNKAEINKCNYEKKSPLFIACGKGHSAVVQILINNTADINKCNANELSPLFIACQNRHLEVVNTLINNKADINKCKDNGISPLYIACQKGHTGIVEILINNKADINKCKDTGASPLFVACQEAHTEVVQMLLNNKADINKCKDTGEFPMLLACYKGHTQIIELLLKHRADCNVKFKGQTPLDIARRENHANVVHLLEKQNNIHYNWLSHQ